MMNYGKDTDELFAELKAASDVENYLNSNRNEFAVPLNEYLKNLLDEKHLNQTEIIKRSGLNREYAYHIFEGNRKNPIGIAMGLSLDEMQYLLKYAKQNPLYPRNPWDSVIIFAVERQFNVLETNQLLYQAGETLLLE